VRNASYGAEIGKPDPLGCGDRPVASTLSTWLDSNAKPESTSVTPTRSPAPVALRRSSAAMMLIAAHMPVVMSISDTGTRAGSPPGWPVAAMMPVKAWMIGS
jgi:hypothetical protein